MERLESGSMISSERDDSLEAKVLSKEYWEEIRRMKAGGVSISEISRQLQLDRKTVRKALTQEWRPYRRKASGTRLLDAHEAFIRERAPEVDYSAQILYQELVRDRHYKGSYDTVKRFVAPLRAIASRAALCQQRFETAPGQQSQIDWGQVTAHMRRGPVKLHVFVLTLGFSRRSFYHLCANEQLGLFLEAHEAAFHHFGGLTREHLYDRPRTIGSISPNGWRWNETFLAFARHWGFEPRVCRPYRAQTKGKVESGVKYFKRNFMPGRRFIDIADMQAQLEEWIATIADRRVHGTTHTRPIERFEQERAALLPITGHASFGESRRVTRIVAEDYLVSYQTNRYSVPFGLIGKVVEVIPVGDQLHIEHNGRLVAQHPILAGRHQMRLLPEHGPGPIARNSRQRYAYVEPSGHRWWGPAEVEVRDLAVYEGVVL